MSYSCENRRFRTNVTKGERHGSSSATRGSVFSESLADNGEQTLWLEYVEEQKTVKEWYWFMWYDRSGRPTIPMSGVLSKSDFLRIVNQLGTLLK